MMYKDDELEQIKQKLFQHITINKIDKFQKLMASFNLKQNEDYFIVN